MSILSKAQPPAGAPAQDSVKSSTGVHGKAKKRWIRRRVAKTLAWISVALTAVMVLSEPWLLLPVITLGVALSLWD